MLTSQTTATRFRDRFSFLRRSQPTSDEHESRQTLSTEIVFSLSCHRMRRLCSNHHFLLNFVLSEHCRLPSFDSSLTAQRDSLADVGRSK